MKNPAFGRWEFDDDAADRIARHPVMLPQPPESPELLTQFQAAPQSLRSEILQFLPPLPRAILFGLANGHSLRLLAKAWQLPLPRLQTVWHQTEGVLRHWAAHPHCPLARCAGWRTAEREAGWPPRVIVPPPRPRRGRVIS